jgi:hypothetical protein
VNDVVHVVCDVAAQAARYLTPAERAKADAEEAAADAARKAAAADSSRARALQQVWRHANTPEQQHHTHRQYRHATAHICSFKQLSQLAEPWEEAASDPAYHTRIWRLGPCSSRFHFCMPTYTLLHGCLHLVRLVL